MSNDRRTRIAAPARVSRGEIVTIRTLIQHPMESGFRRDASGRPVPRDILLRFECRLDDTLVFAADFAPGTAANPFLAFTMRAERSGTLHFTWTDEHDVTTRDRHDLAVD
jgi:sulfur-oxidizing protein SoxZ